MQFYLKMRLLKSQSILRLMNSYLIDSPQPANLSYLWNFGSLLGTCLIIQILTGVFLAMHYTPHVDFAFNSVEHIMRDVNAGYLLRYTHANVASFFFMFVYAHIAKGLFYNSYRTPRVLLWNIGVIIFILMMATAFLGYTHSPKWSIKLLLQHKLTCQYTSYKKNYNPKILKHTTTNNNNLVIQKFIKDKNLNPVYCYNNLHLIETRKQLLYDTKGFSGIYLILNNNNFNYYIGSASTDKIYTRFIRHLIYLKGNKMVANAVNKYKLFNFSFLLLELFHENTNKENKEKLLERENFYLKTMTPKYNILNEAGSSLGYKHSDKIKLKMKSNYSLERRIKIGNLNKGKNLSLETKEKIRYKALIRDRSQIIFSKQSILNMKKNSKPVKVLNLDHTVFGVYNSITDASKSIGCSIKTIHRALSQFPNEKIINKRYIVQRKS